MPYTYREKEVDRYLLVSIIIALLTCVVMVFSVVKGIAITKHKIPLYPIVTVTGAILMIVFRAIPISEIWKMLTFPGPVNPLKILVLFFSMSALSVYLDEAGFFRFLAAKMLHYIKRSQIQLFLLLHILISVLTVFTSNDIVILTFTPFLCYFCKNAKISPIPYLFAEFIAANTASMLLIIGNPTNIYLSLSADIGFIEYAGVMILPTLFASIVSFCVMLLMFHGKLKDEISHKERSVKLDLPETVIGGSCLLCTTVMMVISDFLPFEMWHIALFFALLMFAMAIIHKAAAHKSNAIIKNTILRIPWLLLPFMLSMFVIVDALNYNGVCSSVAECLGRLDPILSYGILSTLSANLVNNIPMSVFFGSVLKAGNVGAIGVYATVIGSNIGAYLTPIGALAGIMWGQILKEHGVKVTFARFCLNGILIVIPTLAAALLGLAIKNILF